MKPCLIHVCYLRVLIATLLSSWLYFASVPAFNLPLPLPLLCFYLALALYLASFPALSLSLLSRPLALPSPDLPLPLPRSCSQMTHTLTIIPLFPSHFHLCLDPYPYFAPFLPLYLAPLPILLRDPPPPVSCRVTHRSLNEPAVT